MDVEPIPDDHYVSRHIDSPHKFSPVERELIEPKVFEFTTASGQVESLVWRKYKVSIDEVHALGCARQGVKRVAKPAWTYQGAITCQVCSIRQINNRLGHGFLVEHDPEEGIQHVAIKFKLTEGHILQKAEKSELRDMLGKVFGPLEPHACVTETDG